MGWDFKHAAKGAKTIDLVRADLGAKFDIVAYGQVGSTFYAAVKDNETGVNSGLVVLTSRRSREYFNFGAKWIDESMGPAEDNAPKRVLQALTGHEPTSEYGAEWRARCWANLTKTEQKIKAGTVIRVAQPLNFGAFTEDTFRFISHTRFIAVSTGRAVRLGRDWKTRFPFQVVA